MERPVREVNDIKASDGTGFCEIARLRLNLRKRRLARYDVGSSHSAPQKGGGRRLGAEGWKGSSF